ncbi:outer membrane beta-barrel protein [Flavobacterium sp. JP2137]|uniref:outer membrane beta-barrel protein n=1 Tax=Flavobacterium sp. JP2137 TaxID=3414510 RepID=UPI003D2FFC5B
MKNLFLMSALILGGLVSVNAQSKSVKSTINSIETPKLSEKVGMTPIKKGNWMVGGAIGSLGYSFEGENFNINVMPKAGYFITDGIAIGLETGVGFQTVKGGDNDWNYSVMPFARYYFPEGASETGRFYGNGKIGISGTSLTAENTNETSFAFGVGLGYSHFVSRNVALEAEVGYNYSKSNAATATAQNGLGVAVGFQIFLGK